MDLSERIAADWMLDSRECSLRAGVAARQATRPTDTRMAGTLKAQEFFRRCLFWRGYRGGRVP